MKLDYFALETLKSLQKWEYPELEMRKDPWNVFIGSGNAFNICSVFAMKLGGVAINTSAYKTFLSRHGRKDFPSINYISASAGKDAVPAARFLKEKGFQFNLITVNRDAPSKEFVTGKIFVLPSFKEPPSFNVSTYGSMLYWLLKEDVKKIQKSISKIEIPDLRKYKNIIFLSDDGHAPIARIAATKVMESLEGISANGEGITHGMHLGYLMQPRDRLVFSINLDLGFEGEEVYRLKDKTYLGSLLSAYYIIGKSQTERDLRNIEKAYKRQSEMLGWKFRNIV
ncbi:MAG: hypothetical protein HYX24_07350 [Candidatus Aenigmarchaeota archaeon]|nr:hypothetical protein [Candidatus Aenigmarchaeota archaeon]